ncbi:acetate/propionate family kinase [Guyparkeria sp. SCN-R1]|uniref:acetate/propionate family kinase n=1 Tax=Guyparkeria sp. SCN-R1 TaxID=2341113 RepID=UPI000F64A37C|nr:acetate/propionate family kinase [Guyparkeria sp. SCN-R1]RRQ20323.1 acetate/propionate family kinase [Guyparkeria sp. SCN-R1]
MATDGPDDTRWLAINAGSSSLKLAIFDSAGHRTHSVTAEDLGDGTAPLGEAHSHALDELLTALPPGEAGPFRGIAHRVVHGGDRFDAPTEIDQAVIDALHEIEPLAPLHNPLAAACIEAARHHFPDTPHFALFDTAFHRDLPPESRDYALPAWCRDELGIRRYGFHGLSAANALRHVAEATGHPPARLNLIVLHLGNGASVTAIRGGHSVATSMGMTPLEGLVMGTRAGDIDPAIPGVLERRGGLSSDEVDHLLNHESGLLGLCGTRDMREIHDAIDRGSEQASTALAMYIHRIRHYVGGYLVNLGRLDALVFTGGIGEHDVVVRESVCEGLGVMGLALDPAANRQDEPGVRALHQPHSPSSIWVVPADEEWEMIRQIQELR